MHLYAPNDMYNFAQLLLQCMHVLPFLVFCCFLSTIVSMTLSARGLAHSGAKKNLFRRTNFVILGVMQNQIFEIELLKWQVLVGF